MAEYDVMEENLKVINEGGNLNRQVIKRIVKSIGNRVLEVGSGIGNISDLLLDRESLILTDYDKKYIILLKKKYAKRHNVRVIHYDITKDCESIRKYKADTVLCMNVLEHIDDDMCALRNMHGILEKNGKLILLVPLYPWLYSEIDKRVGHCRRYRPKELLSKLKKAGFHVRKHFFLNVLGIFGWWYNFKVKKKLVIPQSQMRMYTSIAPAIYAVESSLNLPFGLDIVCICEKKG